MPRAAALSTQTEGPMPRLRSFLAFMSGVGFWLLVGIVPSEVLSWLREWAGRPGPDPNDPVARTSSGKRCRSRSRRKSQPKARGR